MQHNIFSFPNVTITKPMRGRACHLCSHKPLFVEDDLFWQHMEEVHTVFHFLPNNSTGGSFEEAINNILALHSSPNGPKKVLIIGSKWTERVRELLKKAGIRRK